MHRLARRSISTFCGMAALVISTADVPHAIARESRRTNDLPTQYLPVYGGSGGSAFSHSCGDGRVMTGVRFRSGLILDAIGLLCRPVNADGTLGSETTVGTLSGGGGGTAGTSHCPSGTVVTGALMFYGAYVDEVNLHCRSWSATSRSFTGPTQASGGTATTRLEGKPAAEDCEASTQPAHGIRGRSASFVDAFGVFCDEP